MNERKVQRLTGFHSNVAKTIDTRRREAYAKTFTVFARSIRRENFRDLSKILKKREAFSCVALVVVYGNIYVASIAIAKHVTIKYIVKAAAAYSYKASDGYSSTHVEHAPMVVRCAPSYTPDVHGDKSIRQTDFQPNFTATEAASKFS